MGIFHETPDPRDPRRGPGAVDLQVARKRSRGRFAAVSAPRGRCWGTWCPAQVMLVGYLH